MFRDAAATAAAVDWQMDAWSLLRDTGLQVRPLAEAAEDWDRVAATGCPVSHLRNMVAYQCAYLAPSLETHVDLGMVIYQERQPVGIWPFSLRQRNGQWECGSNEGSVLPPYFIPRLPEKTQKRAINQCMDAINTLCQKLGIEFWTGRERVSTQGASTWHRRIMEQGGQIKLAHELYVDLTRPLEVIRAGFRKSYKPLISAGQKLWQVKVEHAVQPDVFTEFRELHRQVAGRVTRPIETWNLQEQAIRDQNAFLVTLRSDLGRMVGCGLFYYTASEAEYAVGAYDRDLFDQPLGHVVQMHAMEYLKQQGASWYRLGERPYPGDGAATDKELNIGYFKEGFASHVFFRLMTTCPVPASSAAN